MGKLRVGTCGANHGRAWPQTQIRCPSSSPLSTPSGGGRCSWPRTTRRAARHTLWPGASAVPPGPLPTNQNPLEGGTECLPFCTLWTRRSPPTSLPPDGGRGRGSKESTLLRFLAFADSYTKRWEIQFIFTAFSYPVVGPVRRADWRQAWLDRRERVHCATAQATAHAWLSASQVPEKK